MLKSSHFRNTFSLDSKFLAQFSSKKIPSGNLYTWGTNIGSLGYNPQKVDDPLFKPQKVDTFDNNVVKIVMGPNHSAVITNTGDLYTFGKAALGVLGHGDKYRNITKPRLVQFFKKHNLKVTDVACGEKMTVAVTDDGDVWSWGSGRRSENILSKFLPSDSNELGQGAKDMQRFSPAPIVALRNLPPVTSVTAGYRFCFALNVKKSVYYWGKGDYGVFGDGHTRGHKDPKLHEFFKQVQKSHGMKIRKIKAAGNYAMAMFNNGTLWSWGENVSGQLGLEDQFNENLENVIKTPLQITATEIEGQRIVDFDLGEEISIFLTNENQVYWQGLKLSTKPTRLYIPDHKKIRKIGAAGSSIIAVGEDNRVYMKNSFLEKEFEDPYKGIEIADFTKYTKGKILDIGGTYSNKFAIVQE